MHGLISGVSNSLYITWTKAEYIQDKNSSCYDVFGFTDEGVY